VLTLQNIINDLNEDKINKVVVGGKKGIKESSTSSDSITPPTTEKVVINSTVPYSHNIAYHVKYQN